ncbi:MAG: fumarylacetoacetate hydrolase family protein [Methanosarcinaceae archaeon]|nr:fumarylacetoacetate hydrolase family protein [Methanosarcinaceae archaeon]
MLGRFKCENDIFFGEISGSLVHAKGCAEGRTFNLSQLEILPPTEPSKIICIGLNYHDHATELKMKVPNEPTIFIKPPSAVIGHDDKIIYPKSSQQLDYEAELAFVIGKKCKNIRAEKANDVIAGYTCFNDVTARDLQQRDGQWTRAKSFDTFAPIGPYIALPDEFDPENASITCRVNGEVRQDSNTSNLIFGIPHLVEFVSNIMTLELGDVISTGTPPGVGELHRFDVVEVEIEGIGILRNEVV